MFGVGLPIGLGIDIQKVPEHGLDRISGCNGGVEEKVNLDAETVKGVHEGSEECGSFPEVFRHGTDHHIPEYGVVLRFPHRDYDREFTH